MFTSCSVVVLISNKWGLWKLIDGLDMWHTQMLLTGIDTQEIKSYTNTESGPKMS